MPARASRMMWPIQLPYGLSQYHRHVRTTEKGVALPYGECPRWHAVTLQQLSSVTSTTPSTPSVTLNLDTLNSDTLNSGPHQHSPSQRHKKTSKALPERLSLPRDGCRWVGVSTVQDCGYASEGETQEDTQATIRSRQYKSKCRQDCGEEKEEHLAPETSSTRLTTWRMSGPAHND